MKKINILYLIDAVQGIGGTEKHLSQLVSQLNKEKFTCSIITFTRGENSDSFMSRIQGHNVYFEHIPVRRIYGVNALIQSFKIRKLIKERDIDIVQTFHFKSDTYGAVISKLSGISHIISSRRDTGDLKKSHHILLNKIINAFITQQVAVADAIANKVSEVENIPRKKFLTVYNGVELPELDNGTMRDTMRREIGISNDDFVIGSVAHMRPEKGYDVFLKSIKLLSADIKNIKGVIVGRVFPEYPEMVKKMGIGKNIIFAGHTDRVREYISTMDVACLTAVRNEGMSNAILEEMAMGKPVIATTVGGSPELVVNNETGILIHPGDSEVLSKAILSLYRDRGLLEKMGKNARERVKREFTVSKMTERMEQLYSDIYNNK